MIRSIIILYIKKVIDALERMKKNDYQIFRRTN